MVADGDAAGGEHDVAGGGSDARGDRRAIVADHAEVGRLGAGLVDRGRQRVRRGVDPLAAARRRGDVDQLVAGGQDRDPRTARDLDLGDAERGEQPELAGPEHGAGAEDDGARGDVLALAPHVVTGRHRRHLDQAVGVAGVLAWHHRVGAERHRRAGEDAHRGARAQGRRRQRAGGDLAVDRSRAGAVGRAHRVAVHRGVVEAGQVAGRDHRRHQRAPVGGAEGDALAARRAGGGDDQRPGLLDGVHASTIAVGRWYSRAMRSCLPWVLLLGCAGSSGAVAPTPTPTPTPPAPPPVSIDVPQEVHLRGVRQLTFGGENAEAYWSAGGDQLIFQTTRAPYACDQIMTMPAHGSGVPSPTLVSTGTGRTTCAYFAGDDADVIYASTHALGPDCPPPPDRAQGYVWALYDYAIYRARADGSAPQVLTDVVGAYDAEATVCATDGSIVFTSDRDGDLELYRMDADGGNVRRLTHTAGYDGGAFFSADCTQLVWRASPAGEALADYQRLLAS
ncbi:MAG: hypothetical protein R2939_07530 [Kofleriaceae bacterium]